LRDVPVQVAGVRVQPGDWLYADEDGMVLMPHGPQG
jgi:regulator of ribonuclease activity A